MNEDQTPMTPEVRAHVEAMRAKALLEVEAVNASIRSVTPDRHGTQGYLAHSLQRAYVVLEHYRELIALDNLYRTRANIAVLDSGS